jgi:hydroxyacylglutathione hydrolase
MIGCLQSGQAFVIDPKRDIEDYLKTADENGLKITGIIDTHIHADHISGGCACVQCHWRDDGLGRSV